MLPDKLKLLIEKRFTVFTLYWLYRVVVCPVASVGGFPPKDPGTLIS